MPSKYAVLRTLIPSFILFITSFIVLTPYLWNGMMPTHSSIFNTVWLDGFSQQLKTGEFYPRWLPESLQSFGSPAFYFYAPLPFYLGTPFVWLTKNPSLSVIITSMIILWLSGLSFYSFIKSHIDKTTALISAIIYIILPYHLASDTIIRGAIGEQASFIFIPLCMKYALDLGNQRSIPKLALSITGLCLSHIPSLLVFIPFLVFTFIYKAIQTKQINIIYNAGITALISILLSSIYLLPAYFLREFINAKHWFVYTPTEHFLPVIPKDHFDIILMSSFFLIAATTAFYTILFKRKTDHKPQNLWFIFTVSSLFLTSILSYFLWEYLLISRYIQFPWRVLTIGEFACATLLAFSIFYFKEYQQKILIAIGFLSLFSYYNAYLLSSQLYTNINLEQQIKSGLNPPEYLPFCAPQEQTHKLNIYSANHWIEKRIKPQLAPMEKPIKRDRSIIFSLSNSPDKELILPLFYYPFLTATVNGQNIATVCDKNTGLIQIKLPTQIESPIKLEINRKILPIEKLGFFLSFIGLIMLIFLTFMPARWIKFKW